MVHGLSCSMACGILVPRPGIEPMSSALQGGFSTTGYQWKSPCANFCVICFQFSLPVEMLGRMVTLFIHLKNCQPVFLNFPKTQFFFFLQSHQQLMGIPVSPHPQQHLLLSVFLILAILVDVNRYLLVVLICITLVIDHVECFFMCFSTICMSSLEK